MNDTANVLFEIIRISFIIFLVVMNIIYGITVRRMEDEEKEQKEGSKDDQWNIQKDTQS